MDDISARLANFASAFTQTNRLFSLHFTDPALDPGLLPHTLSGREYVSAPFRFEVECLAADISLELKHLIGLGADIAIHAGDGSDRVLSGIVTGAQQLGSDGGFARFGLTIESCYAVLRHHRNSRVFQDKSVVDIVGLVLDEHIASNPVFAQCFRHRAHLTQSYPLRTFCQQYRESDFAFIERLLREEGISYYFDFDHGDQIGLHTLVLFDSGTALPPAAQADIRFHRADATEDDDTITDWQSLRQLHSGATRLVSFDDHSVYPWVGEDRAAIDHGAAGNGLVASLIDDDAAGHDTPGHDTPGHDTPGHDTSAMNRYATLRQQANDLRGKQFRGRGVVRQLGVGQWFTLHDHPAHEDDAEPDRQFVVLGQTMEARNNLPDGLDVLFQPRPLALTSTPLALTPLALTPTPLPRGEGLNEPGYRNDFIAVRKAIPIVPDYAHTAHAKPTARGAQTATVVGPAGEEIFCDDQGRIKIRFHWMRAQHHDLNTHGASTEDHHTSCWVRVLMPSAGAGFGHQFIPRIGQEVLVDFIEGDIDRPVVIRALYNGHHSTPAFGDVGSLPANKTLSGIRTREHKSHRHNEIIFDDTAQQLRVTLATDHGKTQLNQGYLIHPRSEGKGKPRGEGFELRTDNAGAIRAAQGLLITTEAQLHASGKQLDHPGTTTQLQAAQNLAHQLGDTASQQNATAPTLNPKLDAEPLDNREPYIHLHGEAGVAITTPQSAVIATGQNIHHIAQRDTNFTAGRHWRHHAVESISLFVANLDDKMRNAFKLIAAKGNILAQAQSGSVDITADRKIAITACKENLTATAGKEFLLQSGGGYIRINGGNVEIHCPGTLSMKAKNFVHVGGGAGGAAPLSRSQVVDMASNATPVAAVSLWQSFYKSKLVAENTVPDADAITNNLEQRGLLNAQKAARWQERKKQIARAKEKSATMPASKEREELVVATARFEKNNVAVEKARLSADVYKPEDGPPPGWKNISSDPDELGAIGLNPDHLKEPNSNFRAQIYAPDPKVFGEDMKTTASFKGTDFDSKEDWANNVAQGLDKESLYYKKAVEIGKRFKKVDVDAEITGHSLGGGLASAAARASGKPAITFNAAGLHKNTVTRYGGTPVFPDPDNIQAYRVDGEVLTGTQEQKVGGTAMTSGAGALIGGLLGGPAGAAIGAGVGASAKVGLAAGMPNAAGTPHKISGTGLNPVDRHSMVQVINGIERQKQQDQAVLSKQFGRPSGKG